MRIAQYNIGIPHHLLEFASRAYRNHDLAHGLDHALRVFDIGSCLTHIEKIQMTALEAEELPYVLIGHDFNDHKCLDRCLPPMQVREFYEKHLGAQRAEKVLFIHSNCSWSTRKTSSRLDTGDWMRQVLQDADWLDALGHNGLQRCIDYARHKLGHEDAQAVCTHIKEKLLLIPRELNFESSRYIAYHLEAPLLDYLMRHDI